MKTSGSHHLHIRKRISHYEPYPSTRKGVRILDNIVSVFGILGPIMTIPQVYNVWILKQTEGVSLISWSSYLLFSIVWLYYGIVHKAKPIIISYILLILVNALVVGGLLVLH